MSEEILAFYRRCARARVHFQTEAVRSLPVPKVLDHARRLGLPVDRDMAQVSDHEMSFAFDLAVYSAPPGRSRAIDRVAKRHAALRTEASLVLNALGRSWFSVFRVLGHHPEVGLVLEDALLGGEVWVLDEALAEQSEAGAVLATRLGRVSGFAITCGVVAGLDAAALAAFRAAILGGVSAAELTEDPRFAEAIWKRALGFRVEDGFG